MLASCWHCGVGYAASMGKCPACGSEYRATTAEIVASLRETVFEQLAHGATDEEILAWIEGHSPLQEDHRQALLAEGKQRLKSVSRNRGFQLMAFGILLATIGFVVGAISMGTVGAVGALAMAFVAFTIGAIKAITGWNLADDLGRVSDISPLNPVTSPKDRELS
ncbi:MAG TPA: hypothetical protein VFG20_03645 [Planctomycetaceae bacterium]|nr:hypothetical protein [Planctomycetaceae bacterium]